MVLIFCFIFAIVYMKKIEEVVMSKFYQEPEVEIRKYNTTDLAFTASTPEISGDGGNTDLGDDDVYDPFA